MTTKATKATKATMAYVCNRCDKIMKKNRNHCKLCTKILFPNSSAVQRTIAKIPRLSKSCRKGVGCGNCLWYMSCINCTTSAGVCLGPKGIVTMKESRRDPYGQTLYMSGWEIGPDGQSMLKIDSEGLVRRH